MRNKLNAALASSVALIAAVPMAHAQGLDFAWEGEIEVGIESVFKSAYRSRGRTVVARNTRRG